MPIGTIRKTYSSANFASNKAGKLHIQGVVVLKCLIDMTSIKNIIKEIKAGSGSSAEPFKTADWCKIKYNLPGVEAFFERNLDRELDNLETELRREFEATA